MALGHGWSDTHRAAELVDTAHELLSWGLGIDQRVQRHRSVRNEASAVSARARAVRSRVSTDEFPVLLAEI